MRLFIRFTSDDWRAYAARLADDPETWREANPDLLQYGPYEAVEVDHKRIVGRTKEQEEEIARRAASDAWEPRGAERLYDRFEVVLDPAEEE